MEAEPVWGSAKALPGTVRQRAALNTTAGGHTKNSLRTYPPWMRFILTFQLVGNQDNPEINTYAIRFKNRRRFNIARKSGLDYECIGKSGLNQTSGRR